jgi:hypothetical protein
LKTENSKLETRNLKLPYADFRRSRRYATRSRRELLAAARAAAFASEACVTGASIAGGPLAGQATAFSWLLDAASLMKHLL